MIHNLSMIVAISEDNAIGNNGDLLCHLSADLKHFKEITMGHTIIMGRKTFDSLPKGALPGRKNIVITRNISFDAPHVVVVHSIDEAIEISANDEKRFIIGGAHIYDSVIGMVDKLYLTLIHQSFPTADTRLSNLNLSEWQAVSEERHQADEKNKYPFSFIEMVRK